MVRFFIHLISIAIVASLPIPLQAQRGPDVSSHVQEAVRHAAWAAMSWRDSVQARGGPEQTEKTSRSFKVGPNGTLEMFNVSGNITIVEGGVDTIVVNATKKVRARASDVKDQLARATIAMTELGGRVDVKTSYTGRNNRVSVDYSVTAPAGTTVVARTISGDIRISGIKGEVRVDTVSGDVTVTASAAVSLAKTVSGNVTVTGVSSQGELRVSSLSGNVTIRSARARAIDADSISGEILLADVTCERATAKAMSGSIEFSGPLARSGRYEFKAQSGDVRLALSAVTGFEIDAQTFSGSVRSDFPVTLKAGEPVRVSGIRKGIRGVHGDGGAQLLITAFSGDITIAKK